MIGARGTVTGRMQRWDVSTLKWVPWDGSLTTGALTIGSVLLSGGAMVGTQIDDPIANAAAGTPAKIMYVGGRIAPRNQVYPIQAQLNPNIGIQQSNDTGITPLRINPENGALWVDVTGAKQVVTKSGKATGSTTATTSVLVVDNGLTESGGLTSDATIRVYISYLSYNPSETVEMWWSWGNASGQASPTSASMMRNMVPARSIVAKDFGDSRVIQSPVGGQSLFLNIAAATPAPEVRWNIHYSLDNYFYS